MGKSQDTLSIAWERNAAAVKLRYPQLTDEDLRRLEQLKAIPLATGEVIAGPETILELARPFTERETSTTRPRKGKLKVVIADEQH